MKRITAIILAIFMFANTLIFAEALTIDAKWFYDGELLKIAGNVGNGPDNKVELIVKDDSDEIKYKDISLSGEEGEFVFSVNCNDWADGEYSVFVIDNNGGKYETVLTLPLKGNGGRIKYSLSSKEIWFADKYNLDADNNSVRVKLENAKIKRGLLDKELYMVEGLPDGIDVRIMAEESDVLEIAFYGESKKAITSNKKLTVKIKPDLFMSEEGSEELIIDDILMIESKEAQRVRYTYDDMTFKMKNNTQPVNDTGFTVKLIRNLTVDGKLERGKHFDYQDGNLNGLLIECSANIDEGLIKISLSGNSKNKITKDFEIKDFYFKNIIAEGATEDSLPVSVRVKASKETGGGNGGGGAGSGAAGGFTGSDNTQKEVTTIDSNIKPNVPDKDVTFSDIKEHWAKDYIEIVAGKGIVNGMGNGLFMPDKNVTRAEFVKMVVNMLDLQESESKTYFEDVKFGDWYYTYISAAVKAGIISTDVNFRPNDYISREEITKIVTEAVSKKIEKPANLISVDTFVDNSEISEWAVDYVEMASTLGIVQGDNEKRFRPKGAATRAEACTVIFRTFNYLQFGEEM